jgi:hypothetical protein
MRAKIVRLRAEYEALPPELELPSREDPPTDDA